MRKFKTTSGILVVGVLIISATAMAAGPLEIIPAAQQAKQKAVAPTYSPVIDENWQLIRPYYIQSNSQALKTLFGVNHQFAGVFSTEITPQQAALLNGLGIKTKPVQVFAITGKPTCNNNGTCEPELGENRSCADCKGGGEEPPPARSCYPDNQRPWGINKVNAGSGGTGVKVAVLDTGIDQDHLDLKDNIKHCLTKVSHFKPDTKTCQDAHGHGSHVAGTVGANGGQDGLGIYGVAPEADLMVIKVCDRRGYCYGDDMAAGIYQAADQGANIISMSIGGNNPDPLVEPAIDYAVSQGVLVVAAAGNDGHLDGHGSIDYPGAYEQVVAVGAIDSNEDVAYFSSQGINDLTQAYVNNERDVEFGAPGVTIESTYKDGCYDYKSGTSMATPHVSGLAAKLWFIAGANAAVVRTYLQDRAKPYDLDGPGDDIYTGFGLPTAPTSTQPML